MKLLLELRPALDGHAGIPQESRLLFRGLSLLPNTEVEGLIQASVRRLAKGLPTGPGLFGGTLAKDREIDRLSRVVVSLQANPKKTAWETLRTDVDDVLTGAGLLIGNLTGFEQKLTRFEPTYFRDLIWRSLFARTLPFSDFDLVTKAHYRIASVPWTTMQAVGLLTKSAGGAKYPHINTAGFDVVIAQTPFPGIVSRYSKLVVRYHDAIPIMMPHTISNKAFHQASHYHSLRNNVNRGAYFACVSNATRNDLLAIFPQAEKQSITIHNMVSHHYFDEPSSAHRIPEIVRTRKLDFSQAGAAPVKPLNVEPVVGQLTESTPASGFEYLLIVSTIEPRKNHLSLLAAWEQLRVERFPNLKLVTVGMLGWDHENITRKFKPWLKRGELHMLEDVPSPELRLLYKHARATICPSFGEGFDFSGVEAMRCGGVVAASDIPVHREVYGDAAEYFSPYSVTDLATKIGDLISSGGAARRNELIGLGRTNAEKYIPDNILPKWQAFLNSLPANRAA
jgi:glycosyltransferase involved in cell wall biosynthesis